MSHNVENAIILAAGIASRFAPFSYERHKALCRVKGEVLIERQIRQLKEAGVREIIVVVGYQKENFTYLTDRFGVRLIENPSYQTQNNYSSILAVRDYLGNSYICSSDDYYVQNPFEAAVDRPYYAAVYAEGETNEWCLTTDKTDRITDVHIGGHDSWIMLGHVFWDKAFSRAFLDILDRDYDHVRHQNALWEQTYVDHLQELSLWARRYPPHFIYEFDTLDDLRAFDPDFCQCTGSVIMAQLANRLHCRECELKVEKTKLGATGDAVGFYFTLGDQAYYYDYEKEILDPLGTVRS